MATNNSTFFRKKKLLVIFISFLFSINIFANAYSIYKVEPNNKHNLSLPIAIPQVDSTIYLVVYKTNSNVATLNWNDILGNDTLNSGNYYKIYRILQNSSWLLIDSSLSSFYIDTVIVCGETVNYKIGVTFDSSSAIPNQEIISNINGDYFSDIFPPALTIIDTMVINSQTGDVFISWFPNPRLDTKIHIIYKNNANQVLTPIDSVYGYNNLTYTDTTNSSSPPDILDYAICAIDSCGNQSMLSQYTTIETVEHKYNMSIYPNPSSDFINIEFHGNQQIEEIKIYDISGRIVFQQQLNSKQIKLNIRNLDSGIYIVECKTNSDKLYRKKLTVESLNH